MYIVIGLLLCLVSLVINVRRTGYFPLLWLPGSFNKGQPVNGLEMGLFLTGTLLVLVEMFR